jgi:hypothetical protein
MLKGAIMSKIDLIIDALQDTDSKWSYRKRGEALAAARELQQELAKPEQEPVVEVQSFGEKQIFVVLKPLSDGDKLYTAPPRKEWVGLTDDEIKKVLDLNVAPWSLSGVALQHVMDDARALESKLKEKNGG